MALQHRPVRAGRQAEAGWLQTQSRGSCWRGSNGPWPSQAALGSWCAVEASPSPVPWLPGGGPLPLGLPLALSLIAVPALPVPPPSPGCTEAPDSLSFCGRAESLPVGIWSPLRMVFGWNGCSWAKKFWLSAWMSSPAGFGRFPASGVLSKRRGWDRPKELRIDQMISWDSYSNTKIQLTHRLPASRCLSSCDTACTWEDVLLAWDTVQKFCATPETAAHQAPPSLGFSRQEHWSGLPFPSPMHKSDKWKWSRSVMYDSSWPHGL